MRDACRNAQGAGGTEAGAQREAGSESGSRGYSYNGPLSRYFYTHLSDSVMCQVLVEVTKGGEIPEKHALHTNTKRRPEVERGGTCFVGKSSSREETPQKRAREEFYSKGSSE